MNDMNEWMNQWMNINHPFIHSSIDSFTHSLINSFINSFIFIHSVHSSIHTFTSFHLIGDTECLYHTPPFHMETNCFKDVDAKMKCPIRLRSNVEICVVNTELFNSCNFNIQKNKNEMKLNEWNTMKWHDFGAGCMVQAFCVTK